MPLIARLAGPGPRTVRLLLIHNSPLVNVIIPDMPVASIVSPFVALAIAARNEPAPLSAVFVTGIVAAVARLKPVDASVETSAPRPTWNEILLLTV